MKRKFKKPITCTLIICAGIELLLFIELCSFDRKAFKNFVDAPDTSSYRKVAWTLAQTGTLIPSERTLGYPLFLALGFLIGGYDAHLVLAGQLLLNLLFTWGCWKLLEELAPDVRIGLRIAATLFFFWAGLGMAVLLLSDFLASFFFGVFLYGMLFWRSRLSGLLSGTFLALATLTRPTFTFVPLLLPFAACLIGRVTSRLSWHYVLTCIGLSLAATGVSISYQYFSFGYLGPSDIVTTNIARTLHYASTDRDMKVDDYEAFSERIGREAGAHPDTLSPSQKEKYAKRILLDELESKPGVILLQLTTTFLKYIFIPVESLTERFVSLRADGQTYATHLRPLLVLVSLPLWVLSLIPPQDSTDKKRPYYLLVMMFLLYTAGLTAINPQQGERIRFPVLAYMFPIILWNVCDLWRRLSLRQKASSIRGIGQSIPEQPVSAKQVSNETRT